MTVDAKRQQGLIQIEYVGGFKRSLGQTAFQGPFILGHLGQRVKIYQDPADGRFMEKIEGMKTAIRALVDKGFAIPPDTQVYCTSLYEAMNQAFHFDASFNSACNIVLGPGACDPGRLASISNSNHPGWTKVSITCIHEFGHALHARSCGGLQVFFDKDAGWSGKATNAAKVSGYAGNNKKEFVAEVFAGRMIGKKYSKSVMNEYAELNGPTNGNQFP